MGRSSFPPVNGETIRQARLGKYLSQGDVQKLCAERGVEVDRGNLSRIERGIAKWPAPKSLPVLAAVLGLELDEIFEEAA